MTMRAAIVNLGNRTGDKLVVRQGERTVELARGESTIVDAPTVAPAPEGKRIELQSLHSDDDKWADVPQIVVIDKPAEDGKKRL